MCMEAANESKIQEAAGAAMAAEQPDADHRPGGRWRALYLTFDDGPDPEHTPRILDVLAKNNARASFFLLGEEVERFPAIVQRIVEEGHLLGNHSYNHPHFMRLKWADQLDQIERTDRLLKVFDGRETHRFRPPAGRFSLMTLVHFAARRRSIAFWSYDSLDYQRKSVDHMIDTLRQLSAARRRHRV